GTTSAARPFVFVVSATMRAPSATCVRARAYSSRCARSSSSCRTDATASAAKTTAATNERASATRGNPRHEPRRSRWTIRSRIARPASSSAAAPGVADGLGSHGALDQIVGSWIRALGDLFERTLPLAALAAGAAPVDGRVARDREQPGADAAFRRVVITGAPPHGVERILYDLFRSLRGRQQRVQHAEHHPPVAVVEEAERISVAGRAARDEIPVEIDLGNGYEMRLRHRSVGA